MMGSSLIRVLSADWEGGCVCVCVLGRILPETNVLDWGASCILHWGEIHLVTLCAESGKTQSLRAST